MQERVRTSQGNPTEVAHCLHQSGSNQKTKSTWRMLKRRNLIQRVGYTVMEELESHQEIVRHFAISNSGKLIPPLGWRDKARGWCHWSPAVSHQAEAESQWVSPSGVPATGAHSSRQYPYHQQVNSSPPCWQIHGMPGVNGEELQPAPWAATQVCLLLSLTDTWFYVGAYSLGSTLAQGPSWISRGFLISSIMALSCLHWCFDCERHVMQFWQVQRSGVCWWLRAEGGQGRSFLLWKRVGQGAISLSYLYLWLKEGIRRSGGSPLGSMESQVEETSHPLGMEKFALEASLNPLPIQLWNCPLSANLFCETTTT